MKNVSLVMTVIGEDRPGFVESLASLIADYGANWLESRMSHMAGQFAGILRVEVAEEKERELISSLKGLESAGLRIAVASNAHEDTSEARQIVRFELVGQDRPGIVRQLTRVIAAKGVNVEELNTACVSAAMSGETLFKAEARLRIPEGMPVEELREDLERIASDLMVDIVIEAD